MEENGWRNMQSQWWQTDTDFIDIHGNPFETMLKLFLPQYSRKKTIDELYKANDGKQRIL